MANKIQVKRGVEANLPILDVGEPAFTTDTKKPFIGSDDGNIELATKGQINTLDALKADQTALETETTNRLVEVAVERARINSFTALAAGSTTGDAELIDARIGANNITYANAGEAIRGQVNIINERIDGLLMTKEYNKLLSFLTSSTYLAMDGSEKVASGVKVAMITVEAGETYEVCSKIGGEIALYGIYDINNTLIYRYNDGITNRVTAYVTDTITIPANGKKMKIESYYGHTDSYCKQIVKTVEQYSNSPLKDKKWVAYGDSLTDPITLQGEKNYVDFITDETGSNTVNLGYGGSGFLKNQNYYGRVNTIPVDTEVITVLVRLMILLILQIIWVQQMMTEMLQLPQLLVQL